MIAVVEKSSGRKRKKRSETMKMDEMRTRKKQEATATGACTTMHGVGNLTTFF